MASATFPPRNGATGIRSAPAPARITCKGASACVPTCGLVVIVDTFTDAPCDIDHAQPHAAGGVTCPCNLVPLCRRHHRANRGAQPEKVRLAEQAHEYHHLLIDAIAEHDDELMETYLGDESSVTPDMIKRALRAGTLADAITPVLLGSAFVLCGKYTAKHAPTSASSIRRRPGPSKRRRWPASRAARTPGAPGSRPLPWAGRRRCGQSGRAIRSGVARSRPRRARPAGSRSARPCAAPGYMPW